MKKFHKDNKHINGYDFELLIAKNKRLKPYLTEKFGRTTIDFSDPKGVKELNRSLLMALHGISFWEFPDENLCPPIPSRVDYLHYLSDLVDKSEKSEVRVLDIGTGASLIYPILGISEFDWDFVACDIDKESLLSAQEIITQNGFDNKVELRLQKKKANILQGIILPNDRFTFTICNPPFFKNLAEAKSSNARKTKNLKIKQKRNFAGNANELCYKGGEIAFLTTYLRESAKFPKASKWFTSLVSKKEIVQLLEYTAQKLKVREFKIIPMEQGNKVSRVICWRF